MNNFGTFNYWAEKDGVTLGMARVLAGESEAHMLCPSELKAALQLATHNSKVREKIHALL